MIADVVVENDAGNNDYDDVREEALENKYLFSKYFIFFVTSILVFIDIIKNLIKEKALENKTTIKSIHKFNN